MHILMANFNGDLKKSGLLTEILIRNGIDCNSLDSDGKSPIHVAIKKRQLEALLFANSLPNFKLNVKGRNGRTPLHYSVQKSESESFLALISLNVNLQHRDNMGHTAKHLSLINTAYYHILYKLEKQ